jgi:hypothetical protein
VTAAALAYLLGRCLALLYLYWPCAAVQRRSASTF